MLRSYVRVVSDAAALFFLRVLAIACLCGLGFATVAQAQNVDWLVNIDDTGFDPVPAGGTIEYVIAVDNNGPQAAPANTVTVLIPATTRLLDITGDFTGCEVGGTLLNSPLSPPLDGPVTVVCNVPTLANGGTATSVFDVRAFGDNANNQVIEVTATVPTSASDGAGGTITDRDPANNMLTEETTVLPGAELAITVNASNSVVSGGFIDFDIVVVNNGPDTSNTFTLEFPIPTGVFNVTGAGGGALPAGCSNNGTTVTCTVTGPIAALSSAMRSFQGQVSAAGPSTITSSASVTGVSPEDPVTTNNTDTADTTIDAGTDVSLALAQSGGGNLQIGQNSVFTISTAYSGGAPTGLTMETTIPPSSASAGGYTINFVTPSGLWTCAPPTAAGFVSCTHPALAATGANTNLGTITINTTAASGGTTNVTATITAAAGSPPETTLANNTAFVTATLSDGVVDLRANKRGPNPAEVVVGQSYNYQITATNIGNADFIGIVQMVDSLPAGMSITAMNTRGWVCTPNSLPIVGGTTPPVVGGRTEITCVQEYTTANPLVAGATTENIVLRTQITSDGGGSLTNRNTVSTISTGPDSILDVRDINDTVDVTVTTIAAGGADVSILKTVSQPSVLAGDVQVFTLEIINAGPEPALNVRVIDNLQSLINTDTGPTDAGFISAILDDGTATGFTCPAPSEFGGTLRLDCNISSLPVCVQGSGDCPTIEVSVRPGGEAGSRSNLAGAISSTTADPDGAINLSNATYNVLARADLTVSKNATPDPVRAGQDITYVVTATNLDVIPGTTTPNGLSSANNVTITDILPDNVRFVSATPSSGTCTAPSPGTLTAGDQVICNLGTLVSGGQSTVTIIVTPTLANATGSAQILNSVSVASIAPDPNDSTPDIDLSNNTANVTIDVSPPVLDILVNKVDSVDPVALGGTTVYTLTVTNAGPSDSENVVVTDILPDRVFAYRSHIVSGAGTCGTVPIPQAAPDPDPANRTLECTFPTLPVGASEDIQITMQGIATGSVPNEVVISSDEIAAGFDTRAANNRTSETTTVGTGVVTTTDSSLSGTVYRDLDDGATPTVSDQDLPGETGVAGITITLTGAIIDGSTLSRTEITDIDGNYRFAMLPPGVYTLSRGTVSEPGLVTGQNTVGSIGGTLPDQDQIAAIILPATTAGIDYDFAETPTVPTPDIALIKTANLSALSSPPQAGDIVTYNFTIRNTGDVTLTNVTLTDTVTGVTLTGTPIPSLAPGAQNNTAYSATYALQPGDIGGTISNTARVTGTPPTGGDVADTSGTTFSNDTPTNTPITVFTPFPAITLDKTLNDSATRDGAVVGEELTYGFIITNTGNVPLFNVTITDDLPGVVLSGSPIPQLDPGQTNSTAYTATYAVTAGDIAAGQVVNDATVVGENRNGSPTSVSDDDSETALFETIEAIPEVFPPFTGDGGMTTNMLDSDRLNGGPATLDNVRITVLREDDGVTLDPDTAIITLAPGFPAGKYEVDYRICAIGNPTLCDETTEVVVQLAVPEIETTKMQTLTDNGDGIDGVGDRVNYEITVVNTGNIALDTVTVSDTMLDLAGGTLTLTSGPDFVSASAGSSAGNLEIGETATYAATFVINDQAVNAGGIENTVMARGVPIDIPGVPGIPTEVTDRSDDGDDLDGNTSDDPTVLSLSPSTGTGDHSMIALTKSTTSDVIRRGEAVPYTITIDNNGVTAAGPFTLTDTLPAGFIFVPGSASLTPSQTLAGRITWDGLNIPAQSSLEITLSARALTGARSGEHINRAVLTNPTTGEAVVPEATATVRILPEAVFDCGDVIGKVFTDLNGDGYQNGPTREDGITDQTLGGGKGGKLTPPAPKTEAGIPNVRLVTVDGSIITTDQYGRYSVPCAMLPADAGSNFILKLDTRSLPTGYRVTTENPRVMRLTPGMMTEMNFGATIGKVVRVDLDASAFGITQDGKIALGQPLKNGIAKLLPRIANDSVNLRLTFHVAGNAGTADVQSARRMLKAAEKHIKAEWRNVGHTRLLVEQSIARAGE